MTPHLLAFIPSPPVGTWHLGPIPIRAYALCIILGVVVAVWVSERRWIARGGSPGVIADIATWAVPFGLVGARLYHVITDYELYFGPGRNPLGVFYIWNGGLGIWGAVALGAVGAWIACRRRGISVLAFADAAAPGVVLAQAIGRWGNWFNQELFGRSTTLPWGLWIDPANRPVATPDVATYHPTFLYESLWDVGVAVFVIWADRRFRLGHGRAAAIYAAAYTAGRGWVEALRVDFAHHFLGLRLNDWTSILVFCGALAYLWLTRHKGREESVEPPHEGSEAVAVEPRDDHPDDLGSERPAGAGQPVTRDGRAPPGRGASTDEE
ncbi:MAG: prolipoprotein diacylglyceryl transferase [Streptosporangiaceae bacterium]